MKYSTSNTPVLCIALFCSSSLSAKTSAVEKDLSPEGQFYCITKDNHKASTDFSDKSALTIDNPVADAIYLEADTGKIATQGTSRLQGDVFIQQNSTVFTANQAQINRDNSDLKASGNVILSSDNFSLKSTTIDYNLENKTGTSFDTEYILGTEGIRGKSTQIDLDNNKLHLKDATFTSCPENEGSWHFSSKDIKLDQETQTGTAKHVKFNIGKVPVFYFPWLKFPTNKQRISGFLSPSARFQSNEGISIPYYFNLAPNYDAVVEFSTISGRGIELDNDFRYLSNRHKGQIQYSVIPEDSSYDHKRRDYFNIKHTSKISDSITLNANAEGVSDDEYFDDFSSSLENSTSTSLQRRLEIKKDTSSWLISAAIEDYQFIDPDEDNSSNDEDSYSKLPELKLNYSPNKGPKELKTSIESELIYFFRDDDDAEGTRADIKFKASKKWGDDSWYFKPSASLEHTIYSLSSNDDDDNLTRTLPTFTLDSGLFFDRDIIQNHINNKSYTQTLEPRLFYTYTPYEDQSDIPVFDTSTIDFSESNQLFLENRFSGKDRIADTNQLTFAVSSRLQDREDGNELIKATIGQVFFFSDRQVLLDEDNETIDTDTSSDLILELSGSLNDRFRLASTISIDGTDIAGYDLRLNYQDEKKRIINLSFREIEEEVEQITFSAALPINNAWSVVANSEHDTFNQRNLESLIGLEYQDCCWKTRLVAKRYLTSDNTSYETPVYIEFELKGLGNIGKSATRQIEDKVYGYDDF